MVKYIISAKTLKGNLALLQHLQDTQNMSQAEKIKAAQRGVLDHRVERKYPLKILLEIHDAIPKNDIIGMIHNIMAQNGALLKDYTLEVLP